MGLSIARDKPLRISRFDPDSWDQSVEVCRGEVVIAEYGVEQFLTLHPKQPKALLKRLRVTTCSRAQYEDTFGWEDSLTDEEHYRIGVYAARRLYVADQAQLDHLMCEVIEFMLTTKNVKNTVGRPPGQWGRASLAVALQKRLTDVKPGIWDNASITSAIWLLRRLDVLRLERSLRRRGEPYYLINTASPYFHEIDLINTARKEAHAAARGVM